MPYRNTPPTFFDRDRENANFRDDEHNRGVRERAQELKRSREFDPARAALETETRKLTEQITAHLKTLHEGWHFGITVLGGRTIDLDDLGYRARNAATLSGAAASAAELPALLEKLEANRRSLAS